MASPVHALNHPEFKDRNIRILIKRDDLMYGPCHGNKFRKLKFHLEEFKQSRKKELLTFGGAFSNHLYATAATGFQLNIPTIGIVRGEIDEENPTI
ncbi:MAG: hypothetical protein KDC80_25655, partial [Saprospiraceae bacterium]|nr:hypothetical protein [Saprospiraceae bacterium]